MVPVLKKYKAAAVNAEPGWFDLEESVKRTIGWINEAGEAGCKLIAFPELCTYLPYLLAMLDLGLGVDIYSIVTFQGYPVIHTRCGRLTIRRASRC